MHQYMHSRFINDAFIILSNLRFNTRETHTCKIESKVTCELSKIIINF